MGISFLDFGPETDPVMSAFTTRGGALEFGHMASKSSVRFLAIITSWNDSFQNNITKESLHGRQDSGIAYQNTTRQISLGFKVLATSEEEAMSNIERINLLSKMMYGSYHIPEGSDSQTLAIAPFVQVRWANLVRDAAKNNGIGYDENAFNGGLMCVIDSLSYTFDGDPIGFLAEQRVSGMRGLTPTQISNFGGAGAFLPKAINVSMALTVNHVHELGWNESGDWMGPSSFPYGLGTQADTSIPPTPSVLDSSSGQPANEGDDTSIPPNDITGGPPNA